jgi:hypothetical protein
MEPVTHRHRAIRAQIVDCEVRRLVLSQRASREATTTASPRATPPVAPDRR